MSEITLTGLAGSHPLGAMAAFGLLRCCDDIPSMSPVGMHWRREADWFPVLSTGQPITSDDLVTALAARHRQGATRPELQWADDIKTVPGTFRAAAEAALSQVTCQAREYADFLAAFTAESAVTRNGELEPTAFYMTSGQQKFLKEIRTLAGRVAGGVAIGRRKKPAVRLFREALFGPWRYEDPQHSLGWDPSTERLHALRSRSPTKEAPSGVSAAVWLAFEALPLFPCFISRGVLATRCFSRVGGKVVFTWPVWSVPACLPAVRSLLGLAELTGEQPPLAALRERGIVAVFRAERYRLKTQGAYYILRPACPCT
jgi:hypothetical protein